MANGFPQQWDGSSCAIFVLAYGTWIAEHGRLPFGTEFNFSQEKVLLFRQYILRCLLSNKLSYSFWTPSLTDWNQPTYESVISTIRPLSRLLERLKTPASPEISHPLTTTNTTTTTTITTTTNTTTIRTSAASTTQSPTTVASVSSALDPVHSVLTLDLSTPVGSPSTSAFTLDLSTPVGIGASLSTTPKQSNLPTESDLRTCATALCLHDTSCPPATDRLENITKQPSGSTSIPTASQSDLASCPSVKSNSPPEPLSSTSPPSDTCCSSTTTHLFNASCSPTVSRSNQTPSFYSAVWVGVGPRKNQRAVTCKPYVD